VIKLEAIIRDNDNAGSEKGRFLTFAREATAAPATAGVRWGENQRYTAMLKISNLGNTPIQNHFFGDILKRQVTGELKMRF
jgi:uncharacterized repeat protein (TIGR01451 family)